MVGYVMKTAPLVQGAAGSSYERFNIDPQTGIQRYQPGSAQYAVGYLAELDPRLTPDQRSAARSARLESEAASFQAAVDATVATGQAPEGWTVVQHASDPKASTSAGRPLPGGKGHLLVKTSEVETVASFGFRPVRYAP